MHWSFTNNDKTVSVNLSETSSNGELWGTATLNGVAFPVHGVWQASNGGGNQNRKVSNLQLSGRSQAEVPEYIAISGLIEGLAPNMGPMDLVMNSASSANGQLNQISSHLADAVSQNPPAKVEALPTGGGDMSWRLCNLDQTVTMDLNVSGSGTISGTLSLDHEFTVSGRWAASGSVAGRNASAFEILGGYAVEPGALDLLAAAGTMSGSGNWPQKIEIAGNVAAISEYRNASFNTELLPMSITDQTALQAAYAESYMVIEMGGTDGDAQAVKGWIGPNGGTPTTSPFGTGDYASAGIALTTEQLADIVSPDPSHADTNDIKIPAFESAAATRPVMIQFKGDADHFPQPPLQEYHPDITKIFYDEQAGALVLQFPDTAGGSASSLINFNHGHGHVSGRNHRSVIIEPR